MHRRKHLTPILAAIAVAAAIAPAGAAATVADPPIPGASVTSNTSPDATPLGALRGAGGVNEAAPVASPSSSTPSDGDSFSWAAATIGAAGALALLGVGGGVVLLSRRSGRQPASAG
jgi:hypothetical protein